MQRDGGAESHCCFIKFVVRLVGKRTAEHVALYGVFIDVESGCRAGWCHISDQLANNALEIGQRFVLQILVEFPIVDDSRDKRRIRFGHRVRVAFGLDLQHQAQAAVKTVVHLRIVGFGSYRTLETTKISDTHRNS